MRNPAEKTAREQRLDQYGAARPGAPPASTPGSDPDRVRLDQSARCPNVGSRRLGPRAWLPNHEFGSWLEHRAKQASPNRRMPSRPSASVNPDLRVKGLGGTLWTVFLRVAASSNMSVSRTRYGQGAPPARAGYLFVRPRTVQFKFVSLSLLCLAACSSAWAKSRATVGGGAGDSTIVEYFWMAMFVLGGLCALFLVLAGAYLAVRNIREARVMKGIGRPHGLRYNGLVFKRGYGRRAPSYCPVCLATTGCLLPLQLEKDPPPIMAPSWWLRCPSCKGTWRA